jgi:hypothetical protein
MTAALDSSQAGSSRREEALAQVSGYLARLGQLRQAAAGLQEEAAALVPPAANPDAFEQVRACVWGGRGEGE